LKHSLLVLEALENEVSLLVLKLPNFVIRAHIVVVETLAEVVPTEVLRVEHVSAEVQHCALVNLVVFVVHHGLLRVLSHEVLNKARETAV